MGAFEWADRLELLGYEVLHLISKGYTENVDELIKVFESGKTLDYLFSKYGEEFFSITHESMYNLEDWNEIFRDNSQITRNHDVVRKMALENENDGLLMLLSLILETVSSRFTGDLREKILRDLRNSKFKISLGEISSHITGVPQTKVLVEINKLLKDGLINCDSENSSEGYVNNYYYIKNR